MQKFFVYKRGDEIYIPNRAVYCNIKSGTVYQPYQFTTNPKSFSHNLYKYSTFGPFDEAFFVHLRHRGGKPVEHFPISLGLTRLTIDDQRRVQKAKEYFERDPEACLLEFHLKSPQKKSLRSIDPQTWRVTSGEITHTPDALAYIRRMNESLPAFRGDPRNPPKVTRIEVDGIPDCMITEKEAQKNWATHGSPLRIILSL